MRRLMRTRSGANICARIQLRKATILRSPSLSGSVDDSGKASLGVDLSMASFAKADLVEQSSGARCRQYLAQKGIQKLIFVSPEGPDGLQASRRRVT